MNPSVIVIGAGPGGLASAILLATAGVKVKVLERMPVVGGRTSAIQTDGFKFDLGPTFFLYPRVLEEIFTAAGARAMSQLVGTVCGVVGPTGRSPEKSSPAQLS